MQLSPKLEAKAQTIMQGGAIQKFFGFWNGRCTFFAIAFSVIGCYGWLVAGRDLTSFALFAGSVQALLVAHSAKEDYFQQQNQQQSVNVTVETPKEP